MLRNLVQKVNDLLLSLTGSRKFLSKWKLLIQELIRGLPKLHPDEVDTGHVALTALRHFWISNGLMSARGDFIDLWTCLYEAVFTKKI